MPRPFRIGTPAILQIDDARQAVKLRSADSSIGANSFADLANSGNTRTLMKKAPAETPIAFIRSIVCAYRRYGVDPLPALTEAQIAPELLRDADARVTADQMEELSWRAMRELNDEALGWFSRPLPWGTYGMLFRASLPSTNLRVALSRWCRHYGLLTEDIRPELTSDNGAARLTVHQLRDLGEQREFCLVTTLRNIHGFACWLVDSRIPLIEATFPFPEPGHSRAYGLMFRGAVSFGGPHASISFDPGYLQLPILRDDRDLRQLLLRPLPLIVLQYRRDRLLSQRIRDLLRRRAAEFSNADTLALALNLSTRSMYRRLAEEGASLQKLKDEVRRDVAVQQLIQTRKSMKQVAMAAGFHNEASFNRAFKQWMGQTPGEFRQSRLAA